MTLISPYVDDLTSPSPGTLALKRAIDVLGAITGLALLSPVFAAVAIIIKLDSRGPVFFRQVRVGRGGHLFRIFKFRSMRVEAAHSGPALTVDQDKRVTRFGAFLRRSKLDELPQLINVLVGDMSIVGPRPEVVQFTMYYTPGQRAIMLSAKPGITDRAAILFRDESTLIDPGRDPIEIYRREIMPVKFRYYERYIRQIGILNDLRIILATVSLLVAGKLPEWLALEHEPQSLALLASKPSEDPPKPSEDPPMNLDDTSEPV
jgi:lipopolysaccharide/colanic/teichoic acid biosynthesis glycosyltransferase